MGGYDPANMNGFSNTAAHCAHGFCGNICRVLPVMQHVLMLSLTRICVVTALRGAEQLGNFVQADKLAGLRCHEPPYTPPFGQVRDIAGDPNPTLDLRTV